MKTMRQDAWTADDDRVLAETILRHIREGNTQLAAFEECAERLGRTEAACGYRWNACVRKSYSAGIEIAKAERKKLKNKVNQLPNHEMPTSITWTEVFNFLKGFRQEYAFLIQQLQQAERELNYKQKEISELKVLKERYETELNRLRGDYGSIKEDYKTIVSIMERARKLTILQTDDSAVRPRFRMDANGNLERIE